MSVCAILATWKLTKKQVTPTQKLILLSYADRAGESFECWPSNSRLEKDTGYDRHTICINKQQLIEKGLISYTGEKKGRTKSIDIIRLNYVTPREGYESEVDYRSSVEMPTASNTRNDVSSVEMPTAKQCGNAHTEPTMLEPKRSSKDIPASSKAGSKKVIRDYEKDERFLRFYSAYPKKEDPRDAWKAFKSVIGDNDELLEQVIADIELRKSKHSKWQDRQYIKYPAVYLRKGEYLGEIFNAKDEAKIKQQQEQETNKERAMKQEEASILRAENEIKNNELKQSDAINYRKLAKEAPSKTTQDALKGLMNHLRG
jgi:hypothetical protein